MKSIPNESVDFILTDPPYGTTKCKWDTIIPFEPMWAQLKRIRKGGICLFSKQPFTSILNQSNLSEFKQELIWQKSNHDNPMLAKRKFLNITENISLFYTKQIKYFPQGIIPVNKISRQGRGDSIGHEGPRKTTYFQSNKNYPKNILKFGRDKPNIHPTQKPVALLEYLIKTYTNEGDVVLDFTMGSGSTGVACKNLNRKFIGIEKDESYYKIACERIGQS